MRVLYISRAVPEDYLNEINKRTNASIYPQQTFDLSFAASISINNEVTAYSLTPYKSFPKSKKIFIPSKKINFKNIKINIIGTLNIKILKQIINAIMLFFITLKFLLTNKKQDSIIIIGFPTLEMMVPVFASTLFINQKKILVIPDLPDLLIKYTSNNKQRHSFLTKRQLNYKYIDMMDGYIFLTKHMDETLNSKNKPSIVIEGLIDTSTILDSSNSNKYKPDMNNVILYAGSLNEKFGVKALVDSLKYVKTKNVVIELYGHGDYVENIKMIALNDKRIFYGGVVSRSAVIKLEHKASLLINPRPIANDFTKYSFPSKTIEYMVTGTPLMTTRLPGIPDVYFDYVYTIDEDSPEGIAKSIDAFFDLNIVERISKGELARNFILENKSIEKTAELINDFINKCK